MINSYGLPECLDWVEQASGWKERKGKIPRSSRGLRKGLGMACSHYISGASKPVNWTGEPHATVKIKVDFDGSIVVMSGAADIGQGSSTILVQSVAEVLGLDLSRVRVVTGDSEVVPKDNGSYSSRVTFMVGNAAIDAARNLKAVFVAPPPACWMRGPKISNASARCIARARRTRAPLSKKSSSKR